MMITKHGNRFNKWHYFVCPCCGCEWSAGKTEVHQGTVAYDDIEKEIKFRVMNIRTMFCYCPECGHDTEEVID